MLFAQQAVGQVRRQERQRLDTGQHRRRGDGVAMARAPHCRQPGARRLQIGRLHATAFPWILRNHRQAENLGQAQLRRPLFKINQAGRAHPFDIAAVGRQVQIGLQQLALAVAGFQPQGRRHLAQFAGRALALDAIQAARQLHADGGGAAPAAAGVGGGGGAQQGDRIDPRVPVKPAVLVQQHRLLQARVDLGQRHPQAVLFVGRQRQAQQPAVARIHGARQAGRLAQGRMGPQADENQHQCEDQQ